MLLPSLQKTYELLKQALHNEVVFVTGPPSTGKTTLVRRLFSEDEFNKKYLAAYVDCYSVSSSVKLFSIICHAYYVALYSSKRKSKKNGTRLPDPENMVNLSDFPRYLNEYYNTALESGLRRLYVIVDHIEVFEKTNMMDSFVALCRAIGRGLNTLRLVVISYEGPSDIIHYIAQKSPSIAFSFQDKLQVISCNVWSREDIVNWITRLPPKREEELYRKFVKHIVTLVYTSESKDPRQIRMYCQQNFSEFVEFHMEECDKQIRKRLKLDPDVPIPEDELDAFNPGEIFSTAIAQQFLNLRCTMIDKRKKNFVWTHQDNEIKMPSNTQVLIVAAYVAAYTKPSCDKVNFVSMQKKKRPRQARNPEPIVNRPFTLERLIHIFLALIKQALGERSLQLIFNNDCVLADIERLQNLNILHHHSGYELCSDARYKLSHNIKQNYVIRLAKNVDLELEHINGLQSD